MIVKGRTPKKNEFGINVQTNMGVHRVGVTRRTLSGIKPNDGSYGEMKKDDIYVEWNDGTHGFIARRFLCVIEQE